MTTAVNSYTTSDLVSLINLIGHIPTSNVTFTPTKLLTLSDFELRTAIAKQLKRAAEGYFEAVVEYTQNDTGLYPVPSDAVASTTCIIQVRNGQAIWPVSRQEESELTTTTFPSVGNYSCFIRDNTINVLPIQFAGVLRVTYQRRFSKLTLVSNCALISAIVGQVITIAALPSGWAANDVVDQQAAQPQFDTYGPATIASISTLDLTMTGDISDLVAGDYLCPPGMTCVPQCPIEFQQLLAQRVVCKVYELQGYLDKLKMAKAVLKEMEDTLTAIITPRVQTSPKVVNPSWGGRRPGNSWSRFNPPAGRSNS